MNAVYLHLHQQWRALDTRIADYDARVVQTCREDARSQRLDAVPGFGPLTATALVAAVGDATTSRTVDRCPPA